jgi:hypothetical protein
VSRSLGVDLRALQSPAVIDIERFPFAKGVERGLPGFARAVSGASRATKGELHFAANRAGVNIDDAGRQLAHRGECAVNVLRVNGTDEAVGHVVIDGDGFLKAAGFDDAYHWTKNFLTGDAHRRGDVVEHRWTIEPAAAAVAFGKTFAANEQPGAFLEADVDVAVDLFQRGLVDHWTDGRWREKAIADFQLPDAIEQQLGERAAHAPVHDDAARSRTPLAAGAKCAPHDTIDGKREVGVVEHDNPVLAAHFQRAAFSCLCRCYRYSMPDLVRAGECDQSDVAMAHKRIADL